MIKKQKCSSNSRLLSFNNFFSHPESIFRQMILKSPFLSYTLRYRITLLHFLPIWSFLDLYGIPLPNSDNFPTYTLIELHFLLFYVFSMLFTAFFLLQLLQLWCFSCIQTPHLCGTQSCSVIKETFDLTVTRGTLWSDKA